MLDAAPLPVNTDNPMPSFTPSSSSIRAAALAIGAAALAAALLILVTIGSIAMAGGFLAAGFVAGGAMAAWRLLRPPAETGMARIDWTITRTIAATTDAAVAVTDRAGRLVCANDAYEALFEGLPTPPVLPLDTAGVAALGQAGRTAWRDGRAEEIGRAHV